MEPGCPQQEDTGHSHRPDPCVSPGPAGPAHTQGAIHVTRLHDNCLDPVHSSSSTRPLQSDIHSEVAPSRLRAARGLAGLPHLGTMLNKGPEMTWQTPVLGKLL